MFSTPMGFASDTAEDTRRKSLKLKALGGLAALPVPLLPAAAAAPASPTAGEGGSNPAGKGTPVMGLVK